MLRWSALSLAVAIGLVIGCGSASEDSLFGPPNPNALTGPRATGGAAASSGGSATGGIAPMGGAEATGGATGGVSDAGGTSSTGGVSSGGVSEAGGAGGLDPSSGGSSAEIGTPGVISCAGVPCRSDTSPANTCCSALGTGTCGPEYIACSSFAASTFYCDDAADCGGGAICCATSGLLVVAKCVTDECSGSGSRVQLCRTKAECPEGRECKPWNKIPEYSACQ
jgi:hypothetical protein